MGITVKNLLLGVSSHRCDEQYRTESDVKTSELGLERPLFDYRYHVGDRINIFTDIRHLDLLLSMLHAYAHFGVNAS